MLFSLAMRLSSFVYLAMLILVSANASASASVAPSVTTFSSSAMHASDFEVGSHAEIDGDVISADKQNQPVNFKRDEKINVAVAANFAKPLKNIAEQFTELTGIEVAVTVSSSGTLYAQIQHGASFDVFLSADRARPQALVDNNLVHHGNLVDYAKGKLAFVYAGDLSSQAFNEISSKTSSETNCREIAGSTTEDTAEQLNIQLTDCLSRQLVQLMENPQNKIAIANPKLAPYGDAAQQTLQNLSLWRQFLPHRVMGKNVLQTLQFYTTGSVKGAFVAYSLALDLPTNLPSSFITTGKTEIAEATTVIIPVPETLYQPIVQSLVVNSKTAASLSPNLFEPRPITNSTATTQVDEPAHKNHVETTRPFNLADADGVSSPSLFVQYLMSQGVQHSLIEWGYEPTNASGVGN
ncbi:molybdate ABC transporter substrate-binding protein [Alteromonas sp. PRIM-21]|uniref:molybdate ABC transporter substrate-binding protein n=1 Tax=Alteromonas sp. PRIM-21 TaxID=1454978 RepID=UPI0022B9503F|nr:molybdate ABC transporter substrate-binding protein [Alteromonas sp. PRIM-21]MCZ8530455.1 molybdate ABC transporter substrate-binding protein [Alteromonas sp. PRIM-21]